MKQYTILVTDKREKVDFRDELDTWLIPSADIQITDNPIDSKSAVVTTWGVWLKSRKFIWVKWLAWTIIQIHSNVFKLGGVWWGWSWGGIYWGASPTTVTVWGLLSGTDITGWTYDQIHETELVASINPVINIRGTDFAFGIYEVGRTLATPLIEWRWHLWAWPAGTLTSLDITPTGFNQANPTPNTWYWNNDSNVVIVLGNTRTYTATINDSEWRSVNASWSYTGTFPYYWTSINITTLTKQSLLAIWSTYFPINHVPETGGDKYKADFETANITITWVMFYNTVASAWERMWGSKANSLALRTTSSVTHTVQGNVTNYTRFEHNWPDWGSLQTRFYTN